MYKKRLLEYDEYKNNEEEEEYDLYHCEMNQSDLNIAKLEKKIEDQNKILEEKKNDIKELEKKNNTSKINKQIEKLQNELKLRKKENDKMKEKLKRLEYNNSSKVQNSMDDEYYFKIIHYINLIDQIKRNNYYNIWKIKTLINNFEERRIYHYKKIKNKEIHDYKMYYLDYKKLFMEIKMYDVDNKIINKYKYFNKNIISIKYIYKNHLLNIYPIFQEINEEYKIIIKFIDKCKDNNIKVIIFDWDQMYQKYICIINYLKCGKIV